MHELSNCKINAMRLLHSMHRFSYSVAAQRGVGVGDAGGAAAGAGTGEGQGRALVDCVCSKRALHFKCQKATKYLNWNSKAES